MENANSSVKTLDCELSCLEGDFESVMLYSKEDLEEEIKEDLEEEEEEDDLEYFNTFSTREELEYHEYLLKNPQPSWIRAKVRKGNLNWIPRREWSTAKKAFVAGTNYNTLGVLV
ncbi:hypothetical protein Tco_0495772 [Tanacetum coccineum]